MDELENNTETKTPEEVKEQRKLNRFFGLFLILDVLALVFIVIEIITLINK